MLRCASLLAVLISTAAAAEPVDFNRDVRPVLSNRCFKCHGPDPAVREAELRLDTQDGLFADRGGYAPFVPKDVEASEAVRRIFSEDETERMPPPEAHKDLTPREKEVIKAWVEQGAVWEPHWAFVPPVRRDPPAVKDATAVRNPIDRFVQARLEAEGIAPAGEADRYTLVRRVFLDLIGLPPTPEEAGAFVNDPSPDAYERLVDRLLASPHYGERWARRWLDLARYADTNGYEKDRPREVWHYRDWVIRALNAGMPFDEFTVKQLAGDMLPGATTDDLIATGFHRNTMLNEEGGIDPLEFRFHAMTDRVATTGTTWLGLTTGCAQCHDHKYDPISHREYYGLMAFLDNADEPELPLPDPALDALYAKNLTEADRLLAELPAKWPAGELNWKTLKITRATTKSGETPESLDDGSVLFPPPGPDKDVYTVVVETDGTPIDRLRIETLTDDRLPNRGPGRVEHGNFVLNEVHVTYGFPGTEGGAKPVKIVSATADVEQPGFPASAAIDGKPKTGWAVHAGDRLNADHALTVTFDQPIGGEGDLIFRIYLHQNFGDRHTIGRLRLSVPVEGPKPTEEARREALERRFAEWLAAERARTVEWTTVRPVEAKSNLPLLTVEEDGTIFVTGDTTKQDTYELVLPAVKGVTAIRLEALPDERLPAGGPGMTYYEGPKGDFFLYNIQVTADGKPVPIAKATNGLAADGTGNAASAAMAIDDNLQTGWSSNGRQGERQTAVFAFAGPVTGSQLKVTMGLGRYYASSLGKFRISTTTAPPPEARDFPEEVETLLAKPDGELTAQERDRLRTEFLLRAPELAAETKKIRELRKRPQPQTTLVFRERPAENPRPTFLHNRGEYLQPKERVEPTTLEALNPFPSGEARNRLGFARWLVDRGNPLTARVVANREWAAFFGRGIVPTVQDFGFQGEPPSHPELLDWLALELMGNGESGMGNGGESWSLKRLHRLIVTSHTYRQSSAIADSEGSNHKSQAPNSKSQIPNSKAADPDNRLLSRGPRVRMEAELVRDSALAACGLLVPKIGGSPVRPPQPEGVTETAYGGAKWEASVGQDRYRRSVYTFLKRTAPFAMFSVFDAPSGEACTAKRDVSNTPLQSLTLLNDEMFLEAARAFGGELAARDGSDADRAAYAFRRVLTRPPGEEETARLAEFVKAQRERFAKGELDPNAFAGPGSGDAAERAAWTALVRALLSLDEAVTRS